jgi:hypothetical protein
MRDQSKECAYIMLTEQEFRNTNDELNLFKIDCFDTGTREPLQKILNGEPVLGNMIHRTDIPLVFLLPDS